MSNSMLVKQTLKCELHSPNKWQDDYNGSDVDNRLNLPDYNPAPVYSVDEYPACPEDWMHGSDITSSYFAGITEDWALWLDFNECFAHTHDVAVVLSVQGINPITGQTMVGDNPLRLEQYHKKCPIHDKEFKQAYYCEECGFKWPGQNYMSTTGTPFGMFWLDGFRTPDGKVRQYVISAEKIRSVAAQVMEKRGENPDDRVFAIGMAFYLSKARKPEVPRPKSQELGEQTSGQITGTQPMFFSPLHAPQNWNLPNSMGSVAKANMYKNMMKSTSSTSNSTKGSASSKSRGREGSKPPVIDSRYDRTVYQLGPELTESQLVEIDAAEKAGKHVERFYTLNNSSGAMGTKISSSVDPTAAGLCSPQGAMASDELTCGDIDLGLDLQADDVIMAANYVADIDVIEDIEHIAPITPVKKLEVGAGALVSQRVYDDPKNLKKYWEEKPAGMIYLNYCDPETLKKILDAGKRADKKDGFMQGIQVGG